MANVYDYSEVTEVACAAYDAGERMTLAIAAKYEISDANARHLISKVRRSGHNIPLERLPQRSADGSRLPSLEYERIAKPEPWKQYGACATADPDLFFPKRGGDTSQAKAICASCQCRKACLEYALRHGEKYGIWGGKSERERRVLRRAVRVELHGAA